MKEKIEEEVKKVKICW